MDHISDSFLETNVPLLVLIEAAKSGNEKEVKEYAQVFREHANKLVEVSHKLYMGSHAYTHVHLFLPVGKLCINKSNVQVRSKYMSNAGQVTVIRLQPKHSHCSYSTNLPYKTG